MGEWKELIGAGVFGAMLGAGYLGLLWLTVQRMARQSHPQRWLLASLFLRMLLLVLGFYLIMGDGRWERVMAALAGFVGVRLFTLGRLERRIALESAGSGRSHDH